MEEHGLNIYFTRLLRLKAPWKVIKVELSEDETRTDIYLDTGDVKNMRCPECGKMCPIYDKIERVWRHLDIAQAKCYVHAEVPRIKCGEHNVKRVEVPWAEPQVGHTFAFEEMALNLLRKMPVSAVARQLDVSYDVLSLMIRKYVNRHLDSMDLSNLEDVCIDETSSKRGHRYVTVVANARNGKIVFITEGKGSDTISEFRDWLKSHNGNPDNLKWISCDFSVSFLSGISDCFPKASVVYDKFHLCKMANDALDKIRSVNQVNGKRFKFVRFKLLKNGKNLTDEEKEAIFNIKNDNVCVGLAYEMKESLIQLYDYPDRESAKTHLSIWVDWVMKNGHKRMVSVAKTVKRHAEKILNWFENHMTNGFLEGLNGMIQTTKRVGRGFPNTENFIYTIYFKHGRFEQ